MLHARMEVSEFAFREALTAEYLRVLNASPEVLPGPKTSKAIDYETSLFARKAFSAVYSVDDLRKHIKGRIGGSSAYKAIPKLFTEG